MFLPSVRRVFDAALVVLLAGWAAYTAILSSGYFFSLVPKHRGETAWIVLAGLWLLVAWRKTGIEDTPGAPSEAGRRADFLSVSAACFLLAFALYWPALGLGLLSDDFVLLDRAAQRDFWSASPFWRPVPLALWAAAGATSHAAVGLHVVNVALHAVNGALLVTVARHMGLPGHASAVAGALFLCFPASVEAVAWASGIQDVLLVTGCLVFVLACSSPKHGWRAAGAGLAGLAVALGTKETAVAAPFLAFAITWRRDERWPVLVLAGTAAAVAYVVFRMPAIQGEQGFAIVPSRYFLKELLSRPFATLAVPFTAAELARAPALGVATTAVLLSWLVAAASAGRGAGAKVGTVVRGAAWVLISVAPVYSMFFVSAELEGSRYLYLPACGWALLLSALLAGAPRTPWSRAGLATAAALALVWAAGTRVHLGNWEAAAQVRDRVLADAARQLNREECAVVQFTGVPDSLHGAYVFRNGFPEALRVAGGTGPDSAAAPGLPDAPGCTVEWRDGAFEPRGETAGSAASGWSVPSRVRR